MRQTTGLVSNAPEILEQFANLRCPGKRARVHVEGRDSFDAKIWPWNMAERLVQGIVDLRRRLRRPHFVNYVPECDVRSAAFPAVAAAAAEGEIRRAAAAARARARSARRANATHRQTRPCTPGSRQRAAIPPASRDTGSASAAARRGNATAPCTPTISASAGSRTLTRDHAHARASAREHQHDLGDHATPVTSRLNCPAAQTLERQTRPPCRPRPRENQKPARHPVLGLG